MADTVKIRIITEDRSSSENKKVARSLDDINSSSNKAGKGIKALGSVLSVGLKASVGVGIAALGSLGSTIVSSTVKAADMEQQIANIAAVMQLTATETDKVKELVSNLGLDETLKVSATEAAQAVELLGRNGLELSEIMEGAAKSTILLANSTGADFGQAADIATDAMSIFNISASEMEEVVNDITGVINNSKLNINDYALALGNGAAKVAGAGVEFEEFNVLLAATASNFTSGMTQGTAFSNLFSRLVPSTNKATEAFQNLNLITEDGQNVFFDAEGQFISVENVVGKLGSAMAELSEQERIAFAQAAFGMDALPALNAVAALSTEQFNDFADAVERTDALESAKTRMNTLKGSMEIFQGVIETLSIKIGDKFTPTVRDVVQQLTQFVTNNRENILSFFDGLSSKIKIAIPVVRDIAMSILEFANSNNKLSIAFDLAQKGYTIFSTKTTEFFNFIIGKSPQVLQALQRLGDALWQWIVNATPVVLQKLEEWISSMSNFIVSRLPSLSQFISNNASALWTWIINATPMVLQKLGEWFNEIKNWFIRNGPELSAHLDVWSFRLWDWVIGNNTPTHTSNALEQWADTSVWGKLRTLDSSLGIWINNLSVRLFQWIGDAVPQTITAMTDWLLGLSKGANINHNSLAQQELNKAREAAWNAFNEMLRNIGQSLAENSGRIASALWQGFIDGINHRSGEVNNHVASVFDVIRTVISNALGHGFFFNIGKTVVQGLIDGMNHLIHDLQHLANSIGSFIPQWIKDALQSDSPSKVMIEIGKDVTRGLVIGMNEPNLMEVSQDLASNIVSGSSQSITNNRTANNTFNIATGTTDNSNIRTDIEVLNQLYGTI